MSEKITGKTNEQGAESAGSAGAAVNHSGADVLLPDVAKIIAESIRVRGSVAVRIEPRVFDLHSGARGGYRSLRGYGFTLEIGSAQAVARTLKFLRDVIELGVPLELAKCGGGGSAHTQVWFRAGDECPACGALVKAKAGQRALQLLVETGQADKSAVMAAVRVARRGH